MKVCLAESECDYTRLADDNHVRWPEISTTRNNVENIDQRVLVDRSIETDKVAKIVGSSIGRTCLLCSDERLWHEKAHRVPLRHIRSLKGHYTYRTHIFKALLEQFERNGLDFLLIILRNEGRVKGVDCEKQIGGENRRRRSS